MKGTRAELGVNRGPLLRERIEVSPASKEEFGTRIRSLAKAASEPKTNTTLGQVWTAFRNVLTHSLT